MFLYITADADSGSNTKLKGLLHQIAKVKTDLTQKEHQQISIKQQLNKLKREVRVLEKNYGETTRNLKYRRGTLAKLSKDYANQQIKLQKLHDIISSQINLAYKVENPDIFKTIFGEEKKTDADLILAYYSYILMARLEQIKNVKEVLEHLKHSKLKIVQQTEELKKTENKQQQQKLKLEKAKQDYNIGLDSLKNQIVRDKKKLEKLLIDKENLDKLIYTLALQKKRVMSPGVKTRLCKNFVWPTKGIIVTHFGESIEQSSWKWNGVVISAAENQEIRAISSGKIVYANSLAGYGLLLIIDHENGYMSIYGYNSSLRKGLNANVNAGEVVANIGKNYSEKPRLYFSIRYNGKPIDPEKWCQ